ncbi:MAG TPA: S41 family peptidase, partial [Candidatus Acidoferrales bacterium]|nr:S41 family peptidase [Candidatus Acidoferrales bacterium]
EPQDVEVVRALLPPAHVLADKIEGDVAYLRVPTFEAGKANEIREKLMQFDRQGTHKLVLDLRDCGRGEASEAVAVARLFVSSGTISSLRGQTVAKQEFAADSSKVVWKYPMTVLISGSTTGPAEVVAAGIGGNRRGDLVGTRTFGSASEQKLIPLDNGAALVLTVAEYYTPAGKAIPEDGVMPTVEVRAGNGDQADLGDEEAPPRPGGQPPASREDPVLRKALELLKGEARRAAA